MNLPLWADDPSGALEPRLTEWAPEQWTVAAGWADTVQAFWAGGAGIALAQRMRQRLQDGATIYPATPFKALAWTDLPQVRVVILGQDPYHGPGQAEGLAFSVPPGVKPPPSLRNIFKELARESGAVPPAHGHLASWARQGVLLLNTTLTVEAGQAASHSGWGWEALTDALIRQCSEHPEPKVFLLWGAHAQAKASLIDPEHHLVLRANHPSPLSAMRPPVPFIGCGHFGLTNDWLAQKNKKKLAWLELG